MSSTTDHLEAHFRKNRRSLLNFIRSKVDDGALAEDILQDSLLKALRSPAEIGEEHLVPWFYRIIRNAITDKYRRHQAAARLLETFVLDESTAALPPEDEAILCECFRDLLPTLKPEYAELIEAMDLGGASTEEMAERLNTSSNNLKVRHHRARQQLRNRLETTCRTCAIHGCVDCTCTESSSRIQD